ncbi:hypothetical protein LUZ62_054786 [Rhynchospora pubera]|uniref:Bifunctional inhibitor/plant lipid transfer protein/seed storage helical domain-containing protein n=1 Tax=Rhynchospora pubera TaxID=906938 RepID=A0AAV8DTT6_9POAL|nr:hypothetical protein LUZ62_054786 [Rhynchospora pubera]
MSLALATAMLALIYGSEAHADSANQVHTFWNPIKFAKLVATCGVSIVIGGDRKDPSPECCEVLKQFDLQFLCLFMAPIVRKAIDVEKLIYAALKRDQSLKPGTDCGGIRMMNICKHFLLHGCYNQHGPIDQALYSAISNGTSFFFFFAFLFGKERNFLFTSEYFFPEIGC